MKFFNMNHLSKKTLIFKVLCTFLLTFIFVFIKASPVFAKSYVYDDKYILKSSTVDTLNSKLSELERKTNSQVVFYITDSLKGNDISDAISKASSGLTTNKSAIFAVSTKDRKSKFVVRKGLSSIINYSETDSIVNLPNSDFKWGRYDDGLLLVENQIESDILKSLDTKNNENAAPVPDNSNSQTSSTNNTNTTNNISNNVQPSVNDSNTEKKAAVNNSNKKSTDIDTNLLMLILLILFIIIFVNIKKLIKIHKNKKMKPENSCESAPESDKSKNKGCLFGFFSLLIDIAHAPSPDTKKDNKYTSSSKSSNTERHSSSYYSNNDDNNGGNSSTSNW